MKRKKRSEESEDSDYKAEDDESDSESGSLDEGEAAEEGGSGEEPGDEDATPPSPPQPAVAPRAAPAPAAAPAAAPLPFPAGPLLFIYMPSASDPPRLIHRTAALQRYRLKPEDLDRLPTKPVVRPYPHCATAPPMRLYVLSEVVLAAICGGRARGEGEGRRGGVALPDSCLQRILCCLAEPGMDKGGLVGPSLAARDIANASLACWDLYHASKPAFAALGDAWQLIPNELEWASMQLPRLTKSLVRSLPPAQLLECRRKQRARLRPGGAVASWEAWDRVLAGPEALGMPELKQAARALGAMVTGTKAQLICQILEALGLAAPPCAPAKLLRACAVESAITVAQAGMLRTPALQWLVDGLATLRRRQRLAGEQATFADPFTSLAAARAQLAARGITTRAEFDAAVADAQTWLDARRRA